MDMTYSDIYMLLQREPEAKKYYDSLPPELQAQLMCKPKTIRTLRQLQEQSGPSQSRWC